MLLIKGPCVLDRCLNLTYCLQWIQTQLALGQMDSIYLSLLDHPPGPESQYT